MFPRRFRYLGIPPGILARTVPRNIGIGIHSETTPRLPPRVNFPPEYSRNVIQGYLGTFPEFPRILIEFLPSFLKFHPAIHTEVSLEVLVRIIPGLSLEIQLGIPLEIPLRIYFGICPSILPEFLLIFHNTEKNM